MATRRTTFSKTQRERDKRAKAAAKRERRAASGTDEDAPPAVEVDHEAVAAELASLHQRYDDGRIQLDDFVARRDELLSRLT